MNLLMAYDLFVEALEEAQKTNFKRYLRGGINKSDFSQHVWKEFDCKLVVLLSQVKSWREQIEAYDYMKRAEDKLYGHP